MKPSLKHVSVVALAIAALSYIASTHIVSTHAATQATVITDKTKYGVGETMILSGTGFSANAPINLSVLRPDKLTDFVLNVTADASGTFMGAQYTPALPLTPGRYKITATDGTSSATTASTEADAAAANLDQCRNGGASSPVNCIAPSLAAGGDGWANGDVSQSQGHFIEGYSIPYRMNFTGVTTGTWTVDLSYEIKHGGGNAIDFLTQYDQINIPSHASVFGHTQECIDPTDGIIGAADGCPVSGLPDSTFAIPRPNIPASSTLDGGPPCPTTVIPGQTSCPATSFDAFTGAGKELFSMWGGTITNVTYATLSGQGDLSAANSQTRIRVTFTVPSTNTTGNALLAWGGHIARQQDWGTGNSASSINGSPYHMFLQGFCSGTTASTADCDAGGSQDRALAAGSVFIPPVLTLVKTITNDNGGTALKTDWTLSATGPVTISGATGSAAITNVQVDTGTYALSESGPSGYTASAWVCVGGTQSGSNITLAQGQNATCTINNNDNPASLKLVKSVTNTNGGTATASQWTTSATGPTPISGAGGVGPSNVSAGTYTLSETGTVAGYTNGTTYSCITNGGTPVSSNTLALGLGDTAVCTITNHDNPATLQLVKAVTNTNGGTAVAASWTTVASGPTPLTGAGGVAATNVGAGTYTLSETGTVAGYTNGSTYSCVKNGGTPVSSNTLALAVGDSAVCTITNHDNPATLQLVKAVTNTNGGTAVAASWTTIASGPTPLTGAGGVAATSVKVGTYTLSETGTVTGYTNGTTYSCVTNGGTAVVSNSIALAGNDSAVCTITNHDNPATLQLVKAVTNTNGGTAVAASWTTIASGPSPLTGAGGVAATSVKVGTYTLSETGTVTGYTNGTTYSCVTNGGTAVVSNSIALAGNDSAVCTITNHDNPATLQLVKAVTNTNGGTAVAASWTTSASGPTPLTGAGGVAATSVKVGTYTLSETGTVTGYTNGTTYSCVKNGGTAVVSNSIALAGNDSAVCTITNHDNPATLQLIKAVTNTNGGTAVAASWTTIASGLTPLTGAGGVAATSVKVGTYTLSETGTVTGYTNGTTYSCVKNGGTAVVSNSIALAGNDSAVCTITNHDNGATLQLVKAVTNTNGGTAVAASWTTSAAGPTPLSGAGGVAATSVKVGTYTLSETGTVAGYTNGTTYSCITNGGTAVVSNSIALTGNDSAVCTINNHDNPATLQLVKAVTNTNGGTAVAASWTTSAAGPTPLTGAGGVAATSVKVGTYTLSETGTVAGYTNGTTYSCITNGGTAVVSNSIALTGNDSAVCTITNHDNPATLQLIKNVSNTHGGTAVATSWTTSAAGPTPLSGTGGVAATSVKVGTYTLSETGTVAGYTNGTTYSCVKNGGTAVVSNSIALAGNDSAVCTITNSDQPATLVLVKNTPGFTGSTSFTFAGTGTTSASIPVAVSGGTGQVTISNVSTGAKSLAETVPSGWLGNTVNVACTVTVAGSGATVLGTSTTGLVAAGGAMTANITNLGLGSTVRCVFTNALLPTLTIIKNATGSSGQFSYDVTGGGSVLNGTVLSPPADGSAQVGPTTIGTGSSTVSEHTPLQSGWTLTDSSCTLNGSTTGVAGSNPEAGSGADFTFGFSTTFGDNVVCSFTNSIVIKTTRTQGFWATHTGLSNAVWNGGTLPPGFPATGSVINPSDPSPVGSPDSYLCGVQITAVPTTEENVLMGGFWASISQQSGKGGKRTAIDQARMQMLQQYLGAVLNVHMFGSGSSGLLSTARAAYCGTNAALIQTQIGVLGTFNQSGDNQAFDPVTPASSQLSKAQADIDAWDIPQYPGKSDEDGASKIALTKGLDNGLTGIATKADFMLTATCSGGPCSVAAVVGHSDAPSTTVSVGTYSLTDVGTGNGASYTKGTWSCTNSGPAGSTFSISQGPAGSGTATVAIGSGAVLSCTITNSHS